MPSAHARRNASGSKRWMNCLGSLQLSEGRPNNSSEAARLGTAAHALGEACLLDGSEAWEWLGGTIQLDEHENATVYRPPSPVSPETGDRTVVVPVHTSESADLEPKAGEYPIDADMTDAVQVYLDTVRQEVERLGDMAELSIERQFSLNWLVGYDWDEAKIDEDGVERSPNGLWLDPDGVIRNPDGTASMGPMFGTNDASVFLPFDHLTVLDYKHGQGVGVDVCYREEVADPRSGEMMTVENGNEQELYYALGAARDVGWAFETLDLVIVQPRHRHSEGSVRRWSTTKAYLREFEARLREAAIAVEKPNQPLKAGDWCTFCPAAAVCPELREEAFRVASLEFAKDWGEDDSVATSSAETSDEDLALRMKAIPLLDIFIKSAKAEAIRRLSESETGEACFGKLVRGKANRAFRKDLQKVDEEGNPVLDGDGNPVYVDPFEELEKAGLPRALLYQEPKPKSPAQVEKVRPPELMARLKAEGVKAPAAYIKGLVAQFSHKPEGKITIAPLDDPRDAVVPSVAAADDFAVADDGDSDDE